MKAGRKRTRISLVPFQPREPDATFSQAVIRISRCNLCGVMRVWPYSETVIKDGTVVEEVQHPGEPLEHKPGCPLAPKSAKGGQG